jgi:hypothetical protein
MKIYKTYIFRPAEGKEGQFRLALGGSEHVSVRIKAIDILPIPEMEPFEITGQFRPGTQIALQSNSTCSGWFDLADLIASQDLDVVDQDGNDAHDEFLAAIKTAQQTLAIIGLSWRWMLSASGDLKGLELQLQGLPCSGAALQAMPALYKDNVAAVILKRFSVEAACFDGLAAAGPVPTFFSTSPADTEKQLLDNPALAHSYCQALAAKLLVAEELSSLEAMAYVQSPRPGRGESPFIRVWVPDQQTNKRPRLNLPQLNFAGPIGDAQGINAYKKYKNARICRENIEFFNK